MKKEILAVIDIEMARGRHSRLRQLTLDQRLNSLIRVVLLLFLITGATLALPRDEHAAGCRINSQEVIYTTGELVEYLHRCPPDSIRLMEFSGDGSCLYQSLDEYEDGHLENVLRFEDGEWSLTDRSGLQPDPEWRALLKRALQADAVVYFYGCQAGWFNYSDGVEGKLAEGIAQAFSREFGVATIGCPEFVFYPGTFPDFDGRFFSNPTEPPTEGFSTPGGIWNVFRNGRRYPPLNPAWVTSVKGLPRPRMPAN